MAPLARRAVSQQVGDGKTVPELAGLRGADVLAAFRAHTAMLRGHFELVFSRCVRRDRKRPILYQGWLAHVCGGDGMALPPGMLLQSLRRMGLGNRFDAYVVKQALCSYLQRAPW